MSSHKKSNSCCRRHRRIGYDRGGGVKDSSQKVYNQKMGVKQIKSTTILVLEYRQKASGVWAAKGLVTRKNPLNINLAVGTA